VSLNLTINNAVTGTDQVVACDTYTWIDGNTYSASTASPQVALTAANGCDSVVTLDLTINYTSSGQISVNGCNQVELNGQLYTVSGTYVQTLTNNFGCDSVLTINASVTYSNFIQTQPNDISSTEGQDAQFFILGPPSAQYQWQTNLGLGFQNLSNATQYSGTNTSMLQVSNTSMLNNNQLFRCLVNEGNCTDTSNVVSLIVTPNTSIVELDKKIQVYPNPTSGSIHVILPEASGEINIYDISGKQLISQKVNQSEMELNLSEFTAGTYIIRISQNDLSVERRLVLQK
jgi:hypothetical protein